MLISANLGFLFTEYPLPDAVRAARDAGFDAVEFHFPYDTGPDAVSAALAETSLPAMGLNTRPGDTDAGEFGLAALPGREADARAEIDRAVTFAAQTGTRNVHVMAGRPERGAAEADTTFRDNLRYACDAARPHGIGILIEPINTHDVPGYHLHAPEHAAEIIADLGESSLKMMLDCYHMGRMGRDVAADIATFRQVTGHLQIAAVPDRGAPDHGTLDYGALWPTLAGTGLAVGAEYRPSGRTADSLDWLSRLRAIPTPPDAR